MLQRRLHSRQLAVDVGVLFVRILAPWQQLAGLQAHHRGGADRFQPSAQGKRSSYPLPQPRCRRRVAVRAGKLLHTGLMNHL
jgi:hypothetical protein